MNLTKYSLNDKKSIHLQRFDMAQTNFLTFKVDIFTKIHQRRHKLKCKNQHVIECNFGTARGDPSQQLRARRVPLSLTT